MPKENKRFINPLLRPSQDQPAQDNNVPSTSDAAPAQEDQNRRETAHSRVTPSPAPVEPQSDALDYTASTMHSVHPAQVVQELPSAQETDTRAASFDLPESDSDKKARPAATTGRSTSRSSTARPSNGRNVVREEAVREPIPSYTRSDERSESDDDRQQTQGYRRRAEVRFEHMHERLTVWIDRDLKRGLEDLASRRNLSKTALINEAMADLLKKHNVD